MRLIDADAPVVRINETRKLAVSTALVYLNALIEDNAAETARHAQYGQWVNARDRLPEIGEEVLVLYVRDDGNKYVVEKSLEVDREDGGKLYWQDPYDDYDLSTVTHWMPMPEPPEEVEDEYEEAE